jgi:hypothetical protein
MLCIVFTMGLAPSAAQTAGGTMTPVAGTPVVGAPAAKPAAKPDVKTGGELSKALEFSTTAAAAEHCPGGIVMWSTLSKSHSFHVSSSRYFGKTKHGAYVCEGDALTAGFHQAKS